MQDDLHQKCGRTSFKPALTSAGIVPSARRATKRRSGPCACTASSLSNGRWSHWQPSSEASAQKTWIADRCSRSCLLEEARPGRGQIGNDATAWERQRAGIDVSGRVVLSRKVCG